jgi:CRP/FNR family transcriptional regulator, cyclic AMP receptor protein
MASRGTLSAGSLIADAVQGLAGPRTRRSARVPVDLLAGVPLFSGLSRRHLRRLAALMSEVHYRDGRVVVEAGQPGSAFFVIVEGGAKVHAGKVPTGRPKARLGPGDFFGELSVLDGGPRTATVVADGNLVALRLSRSVFLKMVTREPMIGVKIMAGLASRLRKGAATE